MNLQQAQKFNQAAICMQGCLRVDSRPVALLALWLASSASRKRRGSLFISRRVHVEINSLRRKGKQIKDVICSEEP